MKTVRVGNGRVYEVPESWAEGEKMIIKAMKYHDGRGNNLAQHGVAARVAYGLFGKQMMAADPTQALMYLIQRVCQHKGYGLDK